MSLMKITFLSIFHISASNTVYNVQNVERCFFVFVFLVMLFAYLKCKVNSGCWHQNESVACEFVFNPKGCLWNSL